MFARAFFGKRYFVPTYFPPIDDGIIVEPDIPVPEFSMPMSGSRYKVPKVKPKVKPKHRKARQSGLLRDDREIAEMLTALFKIGIFDD